MADLKTASTYTSTDNGAYIKIRITATNSYGTSSASDSNLDSAVYQSVPVAYAGTYTKTVGLTTATITWDDVTNAADYGYAAISGWKYGYKTGAGSYTFNTTASGVRSADLTGLSEGTLYTFFVEPLNVYQVDGDITTNRGVGTTFTTSTKPAAPTLVNVTRSTNKAVITWTKSPDPSNPVQSYYVEFKNQAGTYQTLSSICQVSAASCQPTTCFCDVLFTTLTSGLSWTIGASSVDIEVQVYAVNSDGTSAAAT